MDNLNAITKVVSLSYAASAARKARATGKRVAFTNGCFDILHAGHVRYLSAARATADMLVVGLNTDLSVRNIKGLHRPINPEALRAEVLAGLSCVDWVVLFDDPDPLALIERLKPDILVKGADWPEDQIVGGAFVKENGGRVERIDLVPDISTTAIIQTIRERYC
jgi:D-beta-D-heptose 7-phosphate kinase/D-beta-D-heptose 1-phosphate adenosyltransferase